MNLGKMSYGAHLTLYPLIIGSGYFAYSSWSKSSAEKAKQAEIDGMPGLRPVDPDNFNPFTPVPFHNNPELRYRYAGIRMWNFLDKKTHLNVENYPYKQYHDVYDHTGAKKHLYNWVSLVPSHNA